LVDPFQVHRDRPVHDHLGDYLGFLEAGGNTPKHISTTATRIRAVLSGIEAKRLADFDAVGFAEIFRFDEKSLMNNSPDE
jgi:hypothetical protein